MTLVSSARPAGTTAGEAADAAVTRDAYRWVVLGIAFSAFFVTFLDRLAWANASLLASKSIGMPLAALGVFVTAFYAGYVVASALSGFATDRFGARLMLVLALLPLAVTTFLFGFTTSFAMGLLLQALMGIFAGADYAACVKIVADWFRPAERGRALGLFSTAPSIGVAVANAVFPAMLGVVPWSVLYWLLGGLTAAIGTACLFGLRDAPATPARSTAVADASGLPWRRRLHLLLSDRNVVLIAVAGFGANWGTWGFAFWATALMVRGYQISPVDAGIITVIFGVAAAVSKPLYGLLSDLLGGERRRLVIFDLMAFAAMLIVFGAMSSKAGFLLAAPFLGLTAVVYSPLLAAMITETVDRSMTATATGVINAFWQLGSVIVPSVVGVVFAATNSFQAALIVLAAGPFVGIFCMLAIGSSKPPPG